MERTTLARRDWLRLAATTAVGAGLGAGCRPGGGDRLAPVRAAPERVIRIVAGLRPFRPSGFVVRAERLGKKTVVHNYGHGGGGVTLSWGTARLAVELAAGAVPPGPVAVLGAGAVGLATARLLQREGYAVTIYARDLPPRTTSNVACASWYPAEGVDPNRRTPEWTEQFVRAARIAYRAFQDLVGDVYGVRWLPNYFCADEPLEEYFRDDDPIRDLFPETVDLGPGEHPFPTRYCRRYWQMLIEPPIYLNALLRDVRIAGGRVVVRAFETIDEVLALPEPLVVNCTGLGAGALFGDEELVPIKGQLTVLLPQPEIDYMIVSGGLYMMPRRDGVLLGGTHERGEWSLDPNPAEAERVMNGHRAFFGAMA